MIDTFSVEERSMIMRAVKSKGNKSTELKLIKLFKEFGIIGWRRNYPLDGKPDFVFPKQKFVVFTDGCFWHGHKCRNVSPKQNCEYWFNKIEKNKNRDLVIQCVLEDKGWQVYRIWECELKKGLLPKEIIQYFK